MLDLSGVEANDGKIKGTYNLRITSAKLAKSKSKGEQMIKIEWGFADGKFGAMRIHESFMLEGAGGDIGRGKLAHLLDTISVPRTLESTDAMLNKLITAEVGPDKDDYTKIKSFKAAVDETETF